MSNPLVSVIVPTYNQEEFVAESIMSAVEQDYEPLEVIVSDDGSSDRTVEIIKKLASEYPSRIKAIVDGPHLGITGNCNRAAKACKGKYIAFHAGDDVFLPGKIKKQVEWLDADERRVLCAHDVEIFDSSTGNCLTICSASRERRKGIGAKLFVRFGTFVHALSVMLRADALPAHFFDERVPICSDWLACIETLAGGGHFGYVEGIYTRHRRHANNITNSFYQSRMEDMLVTIALVESRYPQLVRYCREIRAQYFLLLALNSLSHGNRKHAFQYLHGSMRQHFRVRTLCHSVLAVMPNLLREKIITLYRSARDAITASSWPKGAVRLFSPPGRGPWACM